MEKLSSAGLYFDDEENLRILAPHKLKASQALVANYAELSTGKCLIMTNSQSHCKMCLERNEANRTNKYPNSVSRYKKKTFKICRVVRGDRKLVGFAPTAIIGIGSKQKT